jgi:acetoin utilization deacetylase AcuC-like enzyme
MVRHLQRRGIGRVMVVDWDAHHGDGTQSIFYRDPTVLFCSVHQSPFYPGSGMIEETGSGEGSGYTVNMPVPAGTGDDAYALLFGEVVLPLAREFSPDFIAVSAGQDNHFTDPLTGLALTARGYADLMAATKRLAGELCEGKLAAVLEGGYSVEGGLPYTNLGVIAAMAGLNLSGIREPLALKEQLTMAKDPLAMEKVEHMARSLKSTLAPYWEAFR